MGPHPVAVAANVDDVAVVQQAVDQGRCHDLVPEHRAPLQQKAFDLLEIDPGKAVSSKIAG